MSVQFLCQKKTKKTQQIDEVKIMIKSKIKGKRSNFYQCNFLALKLVAKGWMDF